jgi:hypothetical protein
MVGLNVCLSDEEAPFERRPPWRPPCTGAEAGSWSRSATKPLATLAGGEEDEEGATFGLVGTFLRMSSYRSRRKSSLKRPKVAQAVEKPARFGCSLANWHTLRARRSLGVIRLRTLRY